MYGGSRLPPHHKRTHHRRCLLIISDIWTVLKVQTSAVSIELCIVKLLYQHLSSLRKTKREHVAASGVVRSHNSHGHISLHCFNACAFPFHQGVIEDRVGFFPAAFAHVVRADDRVFRCNRTFIGCKEQGQITLKEGQVLRSEVSVAGNIQS